MKVKHSVGNKVCYTKLWVRIFLELMKSKRTFVDFWLRNSIKVKKCNRFTNWLEFGIKSRTENKLIDLKINRTDRYVWHFDELHWLGSDLVRKL